MNLDDFTERHTDLNNMDRLYKTFLGPDIEYIGANRGFEISYDVSDYETSEDLLIYTDIFGATSTLIKPCTNFTMFSFLNYAILNPSSKNSSFDFVKYYKDLFYDKYVLERPTLDKKYPKVAFLTGSNLYKKGVFSIKDVVKLAVDGFYIKPHPMTDDSEIDYYKSFVGEDRVLPFNTSGADLFLQADEIATTKFSCFSLYALLFDKKHSFINPENKYRGSYKLLNDFLHSFPNPKETLLKLLSAEIPVIFNRELHTVKDVEKSIDLCKSLYQFEAIKNMFENDFAQKVFQDKTPDKLLELFKNYEEKKHIYSSKIQENL